MRRAVLDVSPENQCVAIRRQQKCIGLSPLATDSPASKARRLRQGREEFKVAAIRSKKIWVPSAKLGAARNAWVLPAGGAQCKFVASQRWRGGYGGAENRLTSAPARTLGPRRAPCFVGRQCQAGQASGCAERYKPSEGSVDNG